MTNPEEGAHDVGRRYDRYRPPTDVFESEDVGGGPMRLVFVIGSTDASGGTHAILQHVLEAEKRGDEVTVVSVYPLSSESTRWRPLCQRLRLATLDDVAGEEFDVAVATGWRTAHDLDRVRACHSAYFVQSIDSRFHHASATNVRRLADATYDLALDAVAVISRQPARDYSTVLGAAERGRALLT